MTDTECGTEHYLSVIPIESHSAPNTVFTIIAQKVVTMSKQDAVRTEFEAVFLAYLVSEEMAIYTWLSTSKHQCYDQEMEYAKASCVPVDPWSNGATELIPTAAFPPRPKDVVVTIGDCRKINSGTMKPFPVLLANSDDRPPVMQLSPDTEEQFYDEHAVLYQEMHDDEVPDDEPFTWSGSGRHYIKVTAKLIKWSLDVCKIFDWAVSTEPKRLAEIIKTDYNNEESKRLSKKRKAKDIHSELKDVERKFKLAETKEKKAFREALVRRIGM